MTTEEELTHRLDGLFEGIRRTTHDMTTPLGVIRMALYVLESSPPSPEKLAQYHRVISENTDRLEEYLMQLRDLLNHSGGEDAVPEKGETP